MSDPSKYTIHTQSNQIIEHNAGTVIGIQNSYTTNPEMRAAVADLQALLIQLQTQYPQVTTEAEALPIIHAEFTEIQQSSTSKLATLRQQILNPERLPKPSKPPWVKSPSIISKTACGQKRP